MRGQWAEGWGMDLLGSASTMPRSLPGNEAFGSLQDMLLNSQVHVFCPL